MRAILLRDIVIPLRHNNWSYEELRFSLRSLRNYKHRNVFIGGFIPDFTTMVVQCPKEKMSNPRQDVFHNLRMILNNPGLSENIVVFNDDFFILKPIDEIGIYHGKQVNLGVWKGVSAPTMRVMKRLGTWSAYSYEQHLPFVCEKTKLKYILDKMLEFEPEEYGKVYWRSIYGNFYRIGGGLTPDVKVRKNPVISPDQVFVSSEDTTFGQNLKKYLEPLFPNKSVYEKY